MTRIDHAAYLDAKRSLDDRSIDRGVLSRFAAELPPDPTILEVGAGTVTMVERLRDWGVLDGGRWVAVDAHEAALSTGRRRLAGRSDSRVVRDGVEGEHGEVGGDHDGDPIVRLGDLAVEFRVADAFEYAATTDERFDAVVGCAFFDVVDADSAVETLSAVSSLAYAPITYDGETTVAPPDPDDEAVLDGYHRHMREYRPGGPEGAADLMWAAADVVASGPSPWRIEPPYTDDEQAVLAHLLDTIESAVGETGYDASDWAARRREAVASAELAYTARNRDLLVRL